MSKSSQKLDKSQADPKVAVEDQVQDTESVPEEEFTERLDADDNRPDIQPTNEAGVPPITIGWIRRDATTGEISVRVTLGVDANGKDITMEFMGRSQSAPMFPSRDAFFKFLEDLAVSGKCQIELSYGKAEREDWFPRLTKHRQGKDVLHMPVIIPTKDATEHFLNICTKGWDPMHVLTENLPSTGFGM